MKETPVVSVIVSTYNHGMHIKACLDGILKQETKFPLEIIVGEDDSIDQTRRICEEYAARYPEKIVLFLRQRSDVIYLNGLPTGRFNFIENLKASTGTYIALCEGDDYWVDPLKLQKQVDFMEANPEYGICFHRAHVLRDDGSMTLHPIPEISKTGTYTYKDLLQYHNFLTTASVVYRRPDDFTFPNWLSEIPFGDLGLYKILSKNGKIKCLEDIMSVYRIHSNGIYSKLSQQKRVKQYLDFYKKIYAYLSKEEQVIVTEKQREKIHQLAKLKYPKSKFRRIFFQVFYNLKN